MCMIINSIDLC